MGPRRTRGVRRRRRDDGLGEEGAGDEQALDEEDFVGGSEYDTETDEDIQDGRRRGARVDDDYQPDLDGVGDEETREFRAEMDQDPEVRVSDPVS